MDLITLATRAREASFTLMTASTKEKNRALNAIADALKRNSAKIISANAQDIKYAKSKGMSLAMLDRLTLDEDRIGQMAQGLYDIVALPDPIGNGELIKRPNGLIIEKRRVPLGVVGIIYESRPNVTSDAIGICLKSGNAVVLRGGTEAINSNKAIVDIANTAIENAGMPAGCIGLIEDAGREAAVQMMRLNGYIDVLIPRGGAGLIKAVVENSTVPVIETGTGNCHIYVDDSADFSMAQEIVFNAKCSRPSVCNAAEKLLVSEKIAPAFLAIMCERFKMKGVEIRGCESAMTMYPGIRLATQDDWYAEYSDYIIAIKIVKDVKEAVNHINKYNTKHSDAIITQNYENSQYFLNSVDSAAVYVNASTRFTDGGEFGFGAEIGISTQKLHARGPMGLLEMTSVKYCIFGNGQIK